MEWQRSILYDGGSFYHHQCALVTFFDPYQQYEMVTVNERHHMYGLIVMILKGP